jgi:hypothetical protein
MPSVDFTHELKDGLDKTFNFIKGLPVDTADTLKLVGTVVADVATIKAQIGSGNYPALISDLQSDVAALKAELLTLKSAITTSLNPPIAASTPHVAS